MTLAISALTSSGIVLTADSRQTYRNSAGTVRIGSNNAMKLFKLNESCGVAISGRAFLNKGDEPAKDVGYFINRFIESNKTDLHGLPVKEIAEKLNHHLAEIFVDREINTLKENITNEISRIGGKNLTFSVPDGNLVHYSFTDNGGNTVSNTGWIETIHMIVAGTDKDGVGRAYSILVPKGQVAESDTQKCGAMWVGQTDVVARIIKGYAPEIGNVEFVKEAVSRISSEAYNQLNRMEYIINWGTITLQDAVDFCVLMTRTTESIQRFSDGTFLAPGGIAGVGGPIDIAVITPEDGFTWLKKKALKTEGAETSVDREY